MKKIFFCLAIFSFILAGCNNKFIFLEGESDNWRGEYSANITDNTEYGNYIFGYKEAKSEISFKNLKVTINDGESELNAEMHEGATVRMSTSCSGCSVTNEDQPQKVTIKWDGNAETFYLKTSK